MNYFFNVICEEIGITGGKIIHIDENRGNIKDVFEIILENYEKFPNANWELYPMKIK